MELNEEQMNKLVFDVTERVLLRMPEVIGNLMRNHAENGKIVKEFYKTYPELQSDPLSVRSVVQKVEQDNPGETYKKILEKAAPLIKERMKVVGTLNVDAVPTRDKLDLNIDLASSGEF